jgi:hypothetical protein
LKNNNMFDVKAAREAGYSDEEILSHLTESRHFDVNKAMESGYSTEEIIDYLSASKPIVQKTSIPKEKTVLEKAVDFGKGAMNTASNFATGTFNKVAGNLAGSIGENINKLLPEKSTQQSMDPALYAQLKKKGMTDQQIKQKYSVVASAPFTENLNKSTAGKEGIKTGVFTALELYPGGGELSKLLKSMPGGEKLAQGFSQVIQHVPEALKKSAIEQYYKALRATTKETKAMAEKVVPGLLKKRVVATSMENLAGKAEKGVSYYGPKIDEFFKALPEGTKQATKPVLDRLASLKNKYVVEGKIINPQAVNAIESAQQTIAQFGDSMSADSMRKVRQIFDEHYSVSKGLDDISNYTKKAQRAGADAIREELAKSHPELDKLNKLYSFWEKVKTVADATVQRQIGQQKGKIVSTGIGSILGAEQGYKTGGARGAIEGGVLGAYLGKKGVEFLQSPTWRTVNAVNKARLADYIATGDKNGAIQLINRLIAGIHNTNK